jgi:hypothetical protein
MTHHVARLAFVSNPDARAILIESDTLDGLSAFRLTPTALELLNDAGEVVARGDPGIFGRSLLKDASEMRVANVSATHPRAYKTIRGQ